MADLIRVCGSPNPPEAQLTPASTSFGRLAGIDALTGGFESFDWRVLGRALAGFETMTWEDENALGGSGPSTVSRSHNHGSAEGITVGRRPHNRGSARGITMGRSQGWLSVRGRDNHRSADPQPSISRSNSPTGLPPRLSVLPRFLV